MHELDFAKGKAAIAFRGDVPWHGLGETIQPDDDLDTIQHKGGLDYSVKRSVVKFDREFLDMNAPDRPATMLETDASRHVLYRSDTGDALSVVSPKYQIVQPSDIINFYRDLTERHGFQIEVVGGLKGGRKVWALANTHNAMQLRDNDKVNGYLLLATSYDGSMATQARFTSVRVVCNNTLSIAMVGKPEVSIPHSAKFDADKVKLELGVGDAWLAFDTQARAMERRPVTPVDVTRFLLDVYYGLDTPEKIAEVKADKAKEPGMERFLTRMQDALFASPGAQLASARGTLWGALNAVTYDVDHKSPSRSSDGRLDKAWFGTGNAIKQRALQRALALL